MLEILIASYNWKPQRASPRFSSASAEQGGDLEAAETAFFLPPIEIP